MYRALPVGNRLCEKRNEQRRQELHREKIRTMRASVDTGEPKCLHLEHVRNNLKREQILEERYGEIDRENRILLQKMSDIMRNNNTQSSSSSSSSSGNPNGGGGGGLNRDKRRRELVRITSENQAILKRIQGAQPMYSHVHWEESNRQNTEYLRNCCEYPLVLRRGSSQKPGGSSTRGGGSSGVGLGGGNNDSSEGNKLAGYIGGSGGGTGTGAGGNGGSSGANAGGDLKYLLKEGKKIGEAYYLVEMATDGRTLTISAYDGDTQKTLELLVSEKNHRKLYREANGDYGVLASRLRVLGERLQLADPSGSVFDNAGGQQQQQQQVQKNNFTVNQGKDGSALVKLK